MVARRNPFTGRVSYADPAGVRGLRKRVPRGLMAGLWAAGLISGFGLAAVDASPTTSSSAVSRDVVPVMAPVASAVGDLGPPVGVTRRR